MLKSALQDQVEAKRMQELKQDKFHKFSTGETQQEDMTLKDVLKGINLKEQFKTMADATSEFKKGASKTVGSILEMRKQLFKKAVEKEAKKDMAEEAQTKTSA